MHLFITEINKGHRVSYEVENGSYLLLLSKRVFPSIMTMSRQGVRIKEKCVKKQLSSLASHCSLYLFYSSLWFAINCWNKLDQNVNIRFDKKTQRLEVKHCFLQMYLNAKLNNSFLASWHRFGYLLRIKEVMTPIIGYLLRLCYRISTCPTKLWKILRD